MRDKNELLDKLKETIHDIERDQLTAHTTTKLVKVCFRLLDHALLEDSGHINDQLVLLYDLVKSNFEKKKNDLLHNHIFKAISSTLIIYQLKLKSFISSRSPDEPLFQRLCDERKKWMIDGDVFAKKLLNDQFNPKEDQLLIEDLCFHDLYQCRDFEIRHR